MILSLPLPSKLSSQLTAHSHTWDHEYNEGVRENLSCRPRIWYQFSFVFSKKGEIMKTYTCKSIYKTCLCCSFVPLGEVHHFHSWVRTVLLYHLYSNLIAQQVVSHRYPIFFLLQNMKRVLLMITYYFKSQSHVTINCSSAVQDCNVTWFFFHGTDKPY